MKFINLEDCCTFDGLWTDQQQNGYIFWFPNEQSTGIIYSTQICMLSDNAHNIDLYMEENDIFSFPTIVNGELGEKRFILAVESSDWQQIGNKFAYCFNVLCTSKSAGEYICKIRIGDEGYIKVGADFYGEYEPIYINLSNFGVEIPQTIQKAIYCSDLYEDYSDHILLNRKFKELLSNYWDIVANRGSYKSLLNALEWFEYDDNLKIREIWKRNESDKIVFSDKDVIDVLKDNVYQTFMNNIKTTYIALYCSAYNELPEYDSEKNPILEKASYKWSKEDMQIKIAMLAQFFGKYFLPIHLSILHATIEDAVFTNTIKSIIGNTTTRTDSFSDYNMVECNIKSDSVYNIANVQACVINNTVYKNNDFRFGVSEFPSEGLVDEQLFANQYYGGPGVIVPIQFKIRNQSTGDFIKHTIVNYTSDLQEEWQRLDLYDKFIVESKPINECEVCNGALENNEGEIELENRIDINFKFLATCVKEYIFNFTFITASSKTINKSIRFKVEDTDNVTINVYKIVPKNDENNLTKEQFNNAKNIKYFTSIQKTPKNDKVFYTQYLPCSENGVKLNRTVIITKNDSSAFVENELIYLRSQFLNYLEFHRTNERGVFAVIFISSRFGDTNNNNVINIPEQYKLIRDEMVFYPQFHELVKINGTTLNDYTIHQDQAICCAVEINNGKTVIPFRYGKNISDSEWKFINISTNNTISHVSSSQQPFIAHSNESKLLDPGYYNIEFNYKLHDTLRTCKLNSAFKVVV